MKTFILFTIVCISSVSVQMVNFLPWWSFLCLVFFLGIILPVKKARFSVFLLGFFAGATSWILPMFYYQFRYSGEIMSVFADCLDIHLVALMICIGILGGLISGLALYSGFLLRRGKVQLELQ